MKMAKRILICLLAMSLLLCVVAISVSASQDEVVETSAASFTADTYDDILEYYETEVYKYLNFDSYAVDEKLAITEDAGYFWKSNQNVYVRNEADGDNYLEMSPQSARTGYSSFISVVVDGDHSFFLEASVGASTNLVDFGIYISDTVPVTDDESDGATKINALSPIVKFKFENSTATVEYLVDGEYVQLGTVDCDASSWIDVRIKYNDPYEVFVPGDEMTADSYIYLSSCEIKVGELEVVEIRDIPVAESVAIGLKKGSNGNTVKAKVDDIRIYEGSVSRDLDTPVQTVTENWIADLMDYYNSVESVDEKLAIIGVVNKLTEDHGFVTEDETVNALIKQFTVNSIKVYSDTLAVCIELVAGMTDYTEKLELVNEYAQYKDRIPDNYEQILPSDVVDVIGGVVDAYDNIVAGLEEAEITALEFINVINGIDLGVADYSRLKQICIDVKEAIDLSALDTTYPGVVAAMDAFNDLEYRRDDALTDLYANEVESARVATYLPAKQNHLAASDAYYEEILAVSLENDKITEYRAIYLELVAANADREAKATAYINACLAIENATNDAELQAAVALAEQLRAVLGEIKDVESLEGMTTANKLLSNAQTSLKITSLRCDQYIALVAAIADAKTLEARFAAINAAIAVESGTADSHEGIPEAKIALDEAIAAYNAEINALNAAFASVAEVAADVTSSVNTTETKAIIANVSAIIKKATEIVALPEEN